MRIVGEPVNAGRLGLVVGADLAQPDVVGQAELGQRGAQLGERPVGRRAALPPQQLDRMPMSGPRAPMGQATVHVSPANSRSESWLSVAGSVAPRRNTGRSTSRKIPIGVGPVGVSASLASENACPGVRARRVVDQQLGLVDVGDVHDRQAAVRTADDAALVLGAEADGWPASRRIWLASLVSLSVSAANAPSLNTGQFW